VRLNDWECELILYCCNISIALKIPGCKVKTCNRLDYINYASRLIMIQERAAESLLTFRSGDTRE
jgi:hypothetical protein